MIQQLKNLQEKTKEWLEGESGPLFLLWMGAIALMGINAGLGAIDFQGPFNLLWEWITKTVVVVLTATATWGAGYAIMLSRAHKRIKELEDARTQERERADEAQQRADRAERRADEVLPLMMKLLEQIARNTAPRPARPARPGTRRRTP